MSKMWKWPGLAVVTYSRSAFGLKYISSGTPLPEPLKSCACAMSKSLAAAFQVAVPVGLAAYFGLRRRDLLAASLCLAWAGASAADVSVYIADAPFERLPLIGGDHDWAYLLGPSALGNMNGAAGIAKAVQLVGAALILAGMALCFRGPLQRASHLERRPLIAKTWLIREPRRWVEPETLPVGPPPEGGG